MTSTLSIKNMVCNRCIKVVGQELEKLGVRVITVRLGEVIIDDTLDSNRLDRVKSILEHNGFELVEDSRVRTIEKIKHSVINLIYEEDLEHDPPSKHSEYISENVGQDYRSLSSLFSSVEGVTIEHYIILQKIERVKELLKYGELTLSEISYKLAYSSVQHLSNQFKKVTGMSPREFRKMSGSTRKPLDEVTSKPR